MSDSDQEISDIEQRVHDILIEELKRADIQYSVANARICDNVRTVGVQGDDRTYNYPVEIELRQGDTFVWNPEFLATLSSRITNEVKGINRIVYVISEKS